MIGYVLAIIRPESLARTAADPQADHTADLTADISKNARRGEAVQGLSRLSECLIAEVPAHVAQSLQLQKEMHQEMMRRTGTAG